MHPDDRLGIEDQVYQREFDLLGLVCPWPEQFIGTSITEDDFLIAEHKAVANLLRATAELGREGTRVDRLTIVRGVQAEFVHRGLTWDADQSRLEWRLGDEIRRSQRALTAAGSPAPHIDVEQPAGHGMIWGPGPILFLTGKSPMDEFDPSSVRKAHRVMRSAQNKLEER